MDEAAEALADVVDVADTVDWCELLRIGSGGPSGFGWR